MGTRQDTIASAMWVGGARLNTSNETVAEIEPPLQVHGHCCDMTGYVVYGAHRHGKVRRAEPQAGESKAEHGAMKPSRPWHSEPAMRRGREWCFMHVGEAGTKTSGVWSRRRRLRPTGNSLTIFPRQREMSQSFRQGRFYTLR